MGSENQNELDLDEIRQLLKEKDGAPSVAPTEKNQIPETSPTPALRRAERETPVPREKRPAQKKTPVRRTAGEEALRENQRDAQETELPKNYETYTILHDVITMLAVVTLIFVFFFRLVGVSGSSMYPTFVDKDWLILESNFLYKEVERGDVVVLSVDSPVLDGPIVKRVIATEGQTVDIDFSTGAVYVDGQLQIEPYIYEPTYLGSGREYPLTVPEGCIFVMGDNRNNSLDSRSNEVGCVSVDRVLGKALLIVFPGRGTDEFGDVTGKRDFSRIGAFS